MLRKPYRMDYKKLIIGAILIWTEIFPVGPQLRIFIISNAVILWGKNVN